MDREVLLKLIENDDLGLLEIKQQSYELQNANTRLNASFLEINQFIREKGHEPRENLEDMQEYSLYCRLNYFKADKDKMSLLLEYDEFDLLGLKKTISSIEDVFNDDDMGILTDWSDSIFDLQNIPKEVVIPDYVAQRKPCKNFNNYEHIFRQCHADLASAKRQLIPFAMEQQIDQGDFFVLKGILTYVAKVGEKENINGKTNARLHCIFENGTESNMLLRSLACALYKDGRRVTVHKDHLLDGLQEKETGYIYVLKSHSQRADIQSINHLYKIGYSRFPIKERIKNASLEPTYLMAPVSEIASYRCFDLNPQKFEALLHTFFASVCLNIDIFDKSGQRHTPREWFLVPLQAINRAIELLISKDIVNYRYDPDLQEIVERE